MKYSLLILLAFAVGGYGQPVEGPWVVMETPDSVATLCSSMITIIDQDAARIYFAADSLGQSTVWTALYSIANHELISTPEFVRSDTHPNSLQGASAEGTDAWILVYLRQMGPECTLTKSISGHGNGRFDFEIGVTYPPSEYFAGRITSRVDLAARVGGGWTLTWAHWADGGPPYHDDFSSSAFVARSSSDSIEDVQELVLAHNVFTFDPPRMAAGFSIAQDTSLVLVQGSSGFSHWPMLLRAVAGADPHALDTVCTYNCGADPISFRPTDTGEYVFYSADNYYADNAMVHVDQAGSCESLGSLNTTTSPAQVVFHGGYGFAVIWYNPSWIKIGRINLDGSVEEPGIFYWHDNQHVIRHASLAMTDDGRIHVAWAEGPSGAFHESRFMTAWMNWDTPLSTKPSDFIPHPSSLSLSAYPNPFNSELQIQYDLPRAQAIELAVFNLLGQQVAELEQGIRTAGTHQAIWSAREGSGIYFVTLRTGETTRTQKVLLVR
jgi:hypothetical protein